MDTQISWVIYEKPSLYPLDLNEKIKTRINELVKLLSVTDENSEIYGDLDTNSLYNALKKLEKSMK